MNEIKIIAELFEALKTGNEAKELLNHLAEVNYEIPILIKNHIQTLEDQKILESFEKDENSMGQNIFNGVDTTNKKFLTLSSGDNDDLWIDFYKIYFSNKKVKLNEEESMLFILSRDNAEMLYNTLEDYLSPDNLFNKKVFTDNENNQSLTIILEEYQNLEFKLSVIDEERSSDSKEDIIIVLTPTKALTFIQALYNFLKD